MNPFRLFPVVLLATCCAAFAGANQTDLSAFKGNFQGSSAVQTSSSKFKGKSKLHGIVPNSGKTLKLKVKASVKADGSDVPIDNEFRFTKSGAFKTSTLLPGTGYDIEVKGRYKATPDEITFQGKWKYGTSKGTFSGSAKAKNSGVLEITYSVFLTGETDPIYVYTYKGK